MADGPNIVSRAFALFRSMADPTQNGPVKGDGAPMPAITDRNGVLWVRQFGAAPPPSGYTITGAADHLLVPFNPNPDGFGAFAYGFNSVNWDRVQVVANNADFSATATGALQTVAPNYAWLNPGWGRIAAGNTNGDAKPVLDGLSGWALITRPELYLFNGASWDRARSAGDNADAVAISTLGYQVAISRLTGFNGTNWDRLRSNADNADNISAVTQGVLTVGARLYGASGNFWSRIQQVGTNNDGLSSPNVSGGALLDRNVPALWNGATFDREYAASAANVSSVTKTGMPMVSPPGMWSVINEAAVNTQAFATKAAGAAGVRHVLTAFSGSVRVPTGAAVTAETGIRIRDGTLGVGTILWTASLATIGTPVGSVINFGLSGLAIYGSPATALTVEINAASGAGTFQNVSMGGYSTG